MRSIKVDHKVFNPMEGSAGEISVEAETHERNGETHSISISDEHSSTLSSFSCQPWRIFCNLVAFLARLCWFRNADDARRVNNNLQSEIASSSSSNANPGQFNLSALEQQPTGVATGVSAGEITVEAETQVRNGESHSLSISDEHPNTLSSFACQQPTGAAAGASAGNGRRMGCREIKRELVLLLIPVGNLALEIAAVILESLAGENNFEFLLACAAMALVSLLFFTVELHCKPEEIRLFPDIVGIIVTVVQLILVMMGIVLMEMNGTNPIKISICALVAAGVQLICKMMEAKKRAAMQNGGV